MRVCYRRRRACRFAPLHAPQNLIVYGREIYATWYKILVMLESGVDISPVIMHRF